MWPSAEDIRAARRIQGVAFEKRVGRFVTSAYVRVVTASVPDMVGRLSVRMCNGTTDYRYGARRRDAALLFLTDGLCRQEHLSGLQTRGWKDVQHHNAVMNFKKEIIDYNAAENIFLAREGYLEWLGRKIADEQCRAAPVCFGAVQACNDTESVEQVSIDEWNKCLLESERNILLCAPAGFGKSYVVRKVIREVLEAKHNKAGVWITASTGLAALALDGATIHSMAGVQRGKGTAEELIEQMREGVKQRWKQVKAITIEEFSMLSAAFLDLLDAVARRLKWCNKPFGRVRIILVGDLAQLAPVPDLQRNPGSGPNYRNVPAEYAFESKVWCNAKFKCYRLQHCWRYDISGRLGRLLTGLRTAPQLSDELGAEMRALLLNKEVNIEEAVVLYDVFCLEPPLHAVGQQNICQLQLTSKRACGLSYVLRQQATADQGQIPWGSLAAPADAGQPVLVLVLAAADADAIARVVPLRLGGRLLALLTQPDM